MAMPVSLLSESELSETGSMTSDIEGSLMIASTARRQRCIRLELGVGMLLAGFSLWFIINHAMESNSSSRDVPPHDDQKPPAKSVLQLTLDEYAADDRANSTPGGNGSSIGAFSDDANHSLNDSFGKIGTEATTIQPATITDRPAANATPSPTAKVVLPASQPTSSTAMPPAAAANSTASPSAAPTRTEQTTTLTPNSSTTAPAAGNAAVSTAAPAAGNVNSNAVDGGSRNASDSGAQSSEGNFTDGNNHSAITGNAVDVPPPPPSNQSTAPLKPAPIGPAEPTAPPSNPLNAPVTQAPTATATGQPTAPPSNPLFAPATLAPTATATGQPTAPPSNPLFAPATLAPTATATGQPTAPPSNPSFAPATLAPTATATGQPTAPPSSPWTGRCPDGYHSIHGGLSNYGDCAGSAAVGWCILPSTQAKALCDDTVVQCDGFSETSDAGWLSHYPGHVQLGKLPAVADGLWMSCVKSLV